MKIKQEGFTLIEIIIVVVILVICGGLGWVIYTHYFVEHKATSTNTAAKPAVPVTTTPADKGDTLYKDTNYWYSFTYPSDWKVVPNSQLATTSGEIFGIVSPQQDKIYSDTIKNGFRGEGPDSQDTSMVISYWKNIAGFYDAIGGGLGANNPPTLEAFLNNPDSAAFGQKIDDITINGHTCIQVVFSGSYTSYGILCQTNQGIYKLQFLPIEDQRSVTPEIQKIIDSMRFTNS